jgi:serine protease Do
MNKWFDEQRKLFAQFRQLRPTVNPDHEVDPSKSRPKLGILIAPVGDTLAKQLGFDKVEGVIIAEVKSGSLADRSGLRKDDIVIKINGKPIPDTAFFQKEALASAEGFQLEILRRGKLETIKIERR